VIAPRTALVAVLIGLGLPGGPACSLLLHDEASQCRANDDCARFPGTLCDQGMRICVTGSFSDTGGGGARAGGNAGTTTGSPAGGAAGSAVSAGGAGGGLEGGDCPDLDGNGVRDCAESMLPNAAFTTGIAGWTPEVGITQSFSSSDGKGDPRSGSLAITNPVQSATASGLTMAGTTLCLPDATASAYDVYLQVSVGPASDGIAQGGITFGFYATADCEGTPVGMAPTTLLDQTVAGWRLVQEIIHPVAGTRSMLVRLVVVKPFDELTAAASFDNLLVRAR